MSKISKIALILAIALLFVSIFVQDDYILALSTFGGFLFITVSRIIDELYRLKCIKEIKSNNIDHLIVKENSKWTVLLVLILTFNFFNSIRTRYNIYQSDTPNPSDNIMVFLNSLDFSEKILMLTIVAFAILAIICVVQALFNQTIVSKDKVIFYDGTIFNIAEIDDVEYDKWSISKNKQVIKLRKGLLNRTLIINSEDFENVKNMLEIKNKS